MEILNPSLNVLKEKRSTECALNMREQKSACVCVRNLYNVHIITTSDFGRAPPLFVQAARQNVNTPTLSQTFSSSARSTDWYSAMPILPRPNLGQVPFEYVRNRLHARGEQYIHSIRYQRFEICRPRYCCSSRASSLGFLRRRANARHAAPTHFLAAQSSTSSKQRPVSHAVFLVPVYHHIVLSDFLTRGGPAQNVSILEISRCAKHQNPLISACVHYCRCTLSLGARL
jgi:hypothetical protein